ncbi:MAG: DegT/DnrJ/EryC1/StrS family aminotransferase [Candidatus Latescibacterota bacterium]
MVQNWPYEFPGAYWFDEQEERAALDVLRNGSPFRYYGLGEPKYVNLYEERARAFYGVKHALAVNSGTGALECAVTAFNIGPGDEVIIPAFMWVATVGSVVRANAIPALCEVDDSLCMDPKDLERKITSRTKLIIPIHMAGAPCDLDPIMEVANRRGIPVLEDVAQCNGGSYKGRKLGTMGKMGIFSLQLNKNMTCGEGGLVITNDDLLGDRAIAAHDMGLVRVDGRLAPTRPEALTWGGGRRMNELSGALAAVQIEKLPRIVTHMRASRDRIKNMIADTPGIGFRRLNDSAGSAGPFIILMLESEAKAIAVTARLKERGLHNVFRIAEYGLHIYYNITPLVQKTPLSPAGNPWSLEANRGSVYDYHKGACPKSDDYFARSVLIPVPSKLTPELEKQAAGAIRAAVGEK